MPALRLTKRAIEDLPLQPDRPVYFRDTEQPGFGVRVGARRKSYFVETTVAGRNVRHALGNCAHLGLDRALQLARAKLGEMAEGRNPNAERKAEAAKTITLQDAFEDFFAARTTLSPNTVPNYRRSIDLYLVDWANKPISAINRDMVLARHRKIALENGGVTANNVMRHLSSVYNFTSAANGELPPNPIDVLSDARAWTPPRRRRTLIRQHDLPRWYKAVAAESQLVRDFLFVALFTGMRVGEIASLRWQHIDLEARTLTAPRTKNGLPLALPLSAFLHELFRLRRALNPDAEWVFPGRGGRSHIKETKRFCTRVAKASGVSFTMHDLRRTFATIAHSQGIPTHSLKGLLNHRTDNDVTGGYVVASAEDYRPLVDRIAARILELANGKREAPKPPAEAA